jgi:hypothetical protein
MIGLYVVLKCSLSIKTQHKCLSLVVRKVAQEVLCEIVVEEETINDVLKLSLVALGCLHSSASYQQLLAERFVSG